MSKFKNSQTKVFKGDKYKWYVKFPVGVNDKERKMFINFANSVNNTINGL